MRTTEPIGYQTMVNAEARGGALINCITPGRAPRIGTLLDIALPPDRVHFFDPATGMAIFHPPA